jgi:hypothetical protein
MSLGIVIKGTEGIVLAADSRVTLTATAPGTSVHVNFDNVTKLLTFSPPHNWIGVVTYGAAVIGRRTAHSLIPEFEVGIAAEPQLTVGDYARRLSQFFLAQWQAAGMPTQAGTQNMVFVVGGFDNQRSAYGSVFEFWIPDQPDPQEYYSGENFGMRWGGQHEIASRIIKGYDPALPELARRELALTDAQLEQLATAAAREIELRIPWDFLPLQDSVDLATFLIRATVSAQKLLVGIRGVGGLTEVAYVTRTQALTFVQKKKIVTGGSSSA